LARTAGRIPSRTWSAVTTAQLEHEATTSRIGEDQLFYCLQRGISEEDAISMIVNGFCKDVFSELPLEFAVEAQNSWPLVLNTASVKESTC
jgi:Fe-S cluster assembly protein SufB